MSQGGDTQWDGTGGLFCRGEGINVWDLMDCLGRFINYFQKGENLCVVGT